jgi:PPOX class probable F420-dependent enzyme
MSQANALPAIPASHVDLLERPLFAVLATLRPDGLLQANPMWFVWENSRILMTHTTNRQKYRNLQADNRATVVVADPDQPYRFLELRGRVTEVRADPTAALFDQLAERYGNPMRGHDAEHRVILSMHPEAVGWQ